MAALVLWEHEVRVRFSGLRPFYREVEESGLSRSLRKRKYVGPNPTFPTNSYCNSKPRYQRGFSICTAYADRKVK
jgi:hypothetical protein